MKRFIIVLLMIFSLASFAQINIDFPLPIDREHIQVNNLTYRMSQNGDSLGYSQIIIEIKKNQIIVTENSEVNTSFSMIENMTSLVDKESLAMIGVSVSGKMNDKEFSCETNNQGGIISGTSNYSLLYSKNESRIDSLVNKPFIERLASLFLIPPAIDFSQSKQFSYQQYNANDCGFKEITVTKTGDFTVEGPRGKIETYKLEFSGGVAQQRLFISKGEKREIVRIEFENNNWVYELL